MKQFRKKRTSNDILNIIYQKNRFMRCTQLILSLFISASSFNLFFYPRKIIYGGVTGLAIIVNNFFKIEPATFILLINIFLLFICLITLGKERTVKALLVSFLFPLFVKLTANITNYIDLSNADTLLIVIFGGVISGFASGLLYKSGFSGSGLNIVSQILSHYQKRSIGYSLLVVNSLIILLGTAISGWTMALYAVLVLYITSVMTDKVLLGTSNNKAFHLVTSKKEEIKSFIINNLGRGITIVNARGGFTNKRANMIICVIPTREYVKFKEAIQEIDPEAFFVVTDAYEVQGGE